MNCPQKSAIIRKPIADNFKAVKGWFYWVFIFFFNCPQNKNTHTTMSKKKHIIIQTILLYEKTNKTLYIYNFIYG